MLRPELPPAARQACLATPLPDRDLTAAEVTDYWALDAKMIEICDKRRGSAVAAIDGAVK